MIILYVAWDMHADINRSDLTKSHLDHISGQCERSQTHSRPCILICQNWQWVKWIKKIVTISWLSWHLERVLYPENSNWQINQIKTSHNQFFQVLREVWRGPHWPKVFSLSQYMFLIIIVVFLKSNLNTSSFCCFSHFIKEALKT